MEYSNCLTDEKMTTSKQKQKEQKTNNCIQTTTQHAKQKKQHNQLNNTNPHKQMRKYRVLRRFVIKMIAIKIKARSLF